MDFASISPYISAALSFVAGAWVGPYLGGYSRKKGENLATHEDIEKLREQVAAVTTTTEQIKTEISDAAWNRQKRWELKREVLFEASKRLSEITDTLGMLHALFVEEQQSGHAVDERRKAFDRFQRAQTAFGETIYLAAMACKKETEEAFLRVGITTADVASAVMSRKDISIYRQPVKDSLSAAREAIRKELGIDSVP
jgi:hypothetical protein